MNDTTDVCLSRAEQLATEAVAIMRRAVASAEPGQVVALLDDIEGFLELLDATAAHVRIARTEPPTTMSAREIAEDAYHFALAARRDASARLRQLRERAPLR